MDFQFFEVQFFDKNHEKIKKTQKNYETTMKNNEKQWFAKL